MNADDLADRVTRLPAAFADRIAPDVAADLDEYAEVGEYGELVSVLTAHLARHKHSVTEAEYQELAELARAVHEEESIPRLAITKG